MGSDAQDPLERFETWLLHRVSEAVNAREVSRELLTELKAEMGRAKELQQVEDHALAVQDNAKCLRLWRGQVEQEMAALET